MLVIIGHGPSIVGKGLGAWIDAQTVVRLKGAKIPDPADWGTRTDYLCARSMDARRDTEPFWLFPKPQNTQRDAEGLRVASGSTWLAYYQRFKPTYKPSCGLCAVFCAIEFLAPAQIGLAGFDNVLYPDEKGWHKWNLARHSYQWMHDADAEHRCLMSLAVRFTDVTRGQHA